MLRFILVLILTPLVAACSSQPDPLIVSTTPVNDTFSIKVNQLEVVDTRTYSYLYRHKKDDDKATFAPPQQPLTKIVHDSLTPLTDSAPSGQGLKWYVSIEKALIDAKTSALKYELEHHVRIRVEAVRDNRRYSNFYTGKAQSSGALKPAQATIERQFRNLLNNVLNDIANDPKLRLSEREVY